MSNSKRRNTKASKNRSKKLMLINTWSAGFAILGGATTTGILCTQRGLNNPITSTNLSTLLSGYTGVGNFKTTPDFMGVLEQLKQNMIQGGATNIISINDVQLRVGTWNAGSGCVIEPKNASVQYTGSATLSWTVSSKKQISADLTNTTVPAANKFNGSPTGAMILKALKSISGNGNMQLNQLDVTNIILVPDQSGIGTGSADIIPTAHSVVYNENTPTNPDKVTVSFSYVSEPVNLNTIITTNNLGNFDETPTIADVFGRMFSMNITADTMFDPADLNLTLTSSTSASVVAVDTAYFYGTVNLVWTINSRINIQSVFTAKNCGYFIEEPTSFDIWTRAKTLNYTSASSLIPDELTWDILYNSVNISVQTSTSKATMTVINTSTRFYGTVEFTWILDTRTDIHDLIPNVALGNIPSIGGVITEADLRSAVERANPSQTIIWSDLNITINQTEGKASIAPKDTSSNYSGTYVTVFYNALSSGNADGTNWQGWASGSLSTSLTTTASQTPYQVVGTAAITSGSSYVANDFVIPDYIFNSTNSCFYKIISTNSDALKSSKATLTGTLTLGNNMEIIGPYTFNQQSSLTGELFIPNSVQTIGDSAFYDCTGLTFGPDSTSEIKYTSVNATHAHKWCLGYITSGTRTTENVIIANGTFGVSSRAFYQGYVIKTLSLAPGLSNISSYAFDGCSGLSGSTIDIPDSITLLGQDALSSMGGPIGGPAPVKIVLPAQFTKPATLSARAFGSSNFVFDDTGHPGKLMIPKNVVSIGATLFRYDTLVTGNIYIPNSTEFVGDGAFTGTSATWDTTSHPNYTCSFTDEPDYALWIRNCIANPTGTMVIPDGTRGIMNEAFKDKCVNVTSISLPNGLTNISGYSFYGSMSLIQTNLVIPNSVTRIGDYAFAQNSSLSNTSITLPANLQNLSWGAPFTGTNIHNFIGNFTLANPPTFVGNISTGSTTGTVSNTGDMTSQQLLDYLKTYCSLPSGWTAV